MAGLAIAVLAATVAVGRRNKNMKLMSDWFKVQSLLCSCSRIKLELLLTLNLESAEG